MFEFRIRVPSEPETSMSSRDRRPPRLYDALLVH